MTILSPGMIESGLMEILKTAEGRAWLRGVFHKPEYLLEAFESEKKS